MGTVKLMLTGRQTLLLKDIFAQLPEEGGMVLGQFFDSKEGDGFFEVGFMNVEKATKIQEALGTPKMNLTKKMHSVYWDVED